MAIELPRTARDALYVTVGIGVLAFQRAQVARREFEKTIRDNVSRLFDEAGA
ncbi:MAG: hypothetical protein ACRD0I_02260 [Acidimicrobiales bacterium]